MNEQENNNSGIEQSENPEGVANVEKKGWIREAIEREATPKAERKETVEEFAKKHGISSETYFYQMRKKENKARIVNIWLNEALNGGNEVLQKLKENALEGKEKSIELYMKFVLELAENLDIKSGGQTFNILFDNSFKKYVNNSTPTAKDNS